MIKINNNVVDSESSPRNVLYKTVTEILDEGIVQLKIRIAGADELAVLNATTKSSIVCDVIDDLDVDSAHRNNMDDDGVFLIYAYDITSQGWYSFRADDISYYTTNI